MYFVMNVIKVSRTMMLKIPITKQYLVISKTSIHFQFKVLEQISPSQFYVHIQEKSQLGQLPTQQVEMDEHYGKLQPKKGFK